MKTFSPKRIVSAVDLSEHSAYALLWAARLARAFEAEVSVVHAAAIQPPLEFTHEEIDRVLAGLEKAAQEAEGIVGDWARGYLPEDVKWSTVITRRKPPEGILEQVEQLDADLVTMGMRQRSGLMRWIIGSVAEGIMHGTRRPSLICRYTGQDLSRERLPDSRVVLCPVNYSPVAVESLRVATEVARALEARLVVMHALPPDKEAAEDDEMASLCAWVPDDVRGACALQEVVRRGNAAAEVLNYALEVGAGLIVIGAQHRRLAEASIVGTTTERVARLAECPVLVVHREEE